MARCTQCGSSIPDGQRTCSMCYGDPYHGKDGYYLQWLERERQEQEDLRREEEFSDQLRGDV